MVDNVGVHLTLSPLFFPSISIKMMLLTGFFWFVENYALTTNSQIV